jgi:hypothetical protein
MRCLDAPKVRVLDTGVPADPDGDCDVPGPLAEGVYTLATRNHRTGLDLGRIGGVEGVSRWDTPFGPADARLPDAGGAWRYFYVPLGQRSVTVYASGSGCTLRRDDERKHDVDLAGPPGYRRIETLGHDGEIWALADCRGPVWLVDVPPAVAPRWDQLMVPCSVVEDPARSADLARLGVDPGDCSGTEERRF